MKLSIRQSWYEIARHYRLRKALQQPDLRRWEYFVQMLIAGYLSWRWIGPRAGFRFWEPQYWAWLAHYSNLSELATRARLADEQQRPKPEPQFSNFGNLFAPGSVLVIRTMPANSTTPTVPPSDEWPKEITLEGDGA